MTENSNISYLNFIRKIGISSFLQDKPNIAYEVETIKKTKKINENLDEITNLDDLELFIKKSDLNKLEKYSNNPMIGKGNQKAKIFIIGDMPSAEEEKFNKPFAGKSGELLNKMLKAINLSTKDVFLANIALWYINKDQNLAKEDILKCLPYIQKQIEIINPKIILLMGELTAKIILNSKLDFSDLRGKWHQYKSINLKNSIICLTTYHPKHLINFPQDKKFAWKDLQMLQKKIKNEN